MEEFQFEPEPTDGGRVGEGIQAARPVDGGKDRGPQEATRQRTERLMEFCCVHVPESMVNPTVAHRHRECVLPEDAAKALMEVGKCREFEEELSPVCLM